MMDPAVVSLHGSETSEMSAHATNHAGNTSNSLKEETSWDPFGFSHFLWIIPGKVVIRISDELNGYVGDFVFDSLRLKVLVLNFWGLFKRIGVMWHSVTEGIVDTFVFGEDIVELFESFENCGFHNFPDRINYGKSDEFCI